ncbi:MAG: ABC transporter permease [Zetaproteobacteria bacterium]|nr:ABC transporter permease [Zetaproteobacteria bacterium]
MSVKIPQYLIWMAWRQLVSPRGKNLSFMTIISVLGVTIGVATLVIVLSVMGGFERDLKQKMFRGLPHLEFFHQTTAAGFSLQDFSVQDAVRGLPGVEHAEPFIRADVVVKHRRNMAISTIFGVQPELGGQIWGFGAEHQDDSILDLLQQVTLSGHPPLLLSEELSSHMGVRVGDVVELLNPGARVGSALSGQKLSQAFEIVGFFWTRLPQYDLKYVVTSLAAARPFMPDYDVTLDEREYVTGIGVKMQDPERLTTWRAEHLPAEMAVHTWRDTNHSLLLALQLEKFTMSAILLLIVVVAAFSISGTMMMTVYHKRNQVALMRATGMSKRDVLALFLLHGFWIGTVGVVFGLSCGLGVCLFIEKYAYLIPFPDSFALTKLPVTYLPWEYVLVSLSSWGLSLLAAAYPAVTAAHQDPAGGIKCH